MSGLDLRIKHDAWKQAEVRVETALENLAAAGRAGDDDSPHLTGLRAESIACCQLAHALFHDFMEESFDSARKSAMGTE